MKRVKAIIAAIAIAVVSLGVVAPADAASANASVYIVTPKWAGWCRAGTSANRPVVVSSNNMTTNHFAQDWGDDIIGSRVRLGTQNTIHVNVGCAQGFGSYGTTVTIRPTRHNQTFYISPV